MEIRSNDLTKAVKLHQQALKTVEELKKLDGTPADSNPEPGIVDVLPDSVKNEIQTSFIGNSKKTKSCVEITQAPKDSVLISKGADTSKTKSLAEASEIIKSSKKLKELADKFDKLTGPVPGERNGSTGVVNLEPVSFPEDIIGGIYGTDGLYGSHAIIRTETGEEAIAAFKNNFKDDVADPEKKQQLSELLDEIGKVFQNGNFDEILYLNARWDMDTSLTALVGIKKSDDPMNINKDDQMIGIYRDYYSIF